MKDDVKFLPPAVIGDGDLVPNGLVGGRNDALFHIGMVSEMTEVAGVSIKQDIGIPIVDLEDLLDQVAGVYADPAGFVIGPEHHANSHL
jgi:hypothetical protein